MTDKILFVRSYAHAEQNGIAPCDSIMGTVFDASKNTILAYAKGHTFSSRDVARDIGDAAIRTFEFWCDDPGTFDPNPEPNADPLVGGVGQRHVPGRGSGLARCRSHSCKNWNL